MHLEFLWSEIRFIDSLQARFHCKYEGILHSNYLMIWENALGPPLCTSYMHLFFLASKLTWFKAGFHQCRHRTPWISFGFFKLHMSKKPQNENCNIQRSLNPGRCQYLSPQYCIAKPRSAWFCYHYQNFQSRIHNWVVYIHHGSNHFSQICVHG